MRKIITATALLASMAGCAQMDRIIQPRRPSPEERAQQMYMAFLGLQLMQASRPTAPASQIYVIDGRHIVCNQMNNVVICR